MEPPSQKAALHDSAVFHLPLGDVARVILQLPKEPAPPLTRAFAVSSK